MWFVATINGVKCMTQRMHVTCVYNHSKWLIVWLKECKWHVATIYLVCNMTQRMHVACVNNRHCLRHDSKNARGNNPCGLWHDSRNACGYVAAIHMVYGMTQRMQVARIHVVCDMTQECKWQESMWFMAWLKECMWHVATFHMIYGITTKNACGLVMITDGARAAALPYLWMGKGGQCAAGSHNMGSHTWKIWRRGERERWPKEREIEDEHSVIIGHINMYAEPNYYPISAGFLIFCSEFRRFLRAGRGSPSSAILPTQRWKQP